MKTYDEIELHTEDYLIYDELLERDKLIVQLWNALYSPKENITAQKFEIWAKHDEYLRKTKSILGE